MPRSCNFVSKTVAIAILCGAAALVFGQGSEPSQKGDSPPFKVCSIQNPPPCAQAPKPIFTPDPEYNEKARKKKFQGTVILETVVGTDGHTHDIRVVRPLGYGLSDQAVKALREWKFQPGSREGQPVPVVIQVEMGFRLY